ncbi:MAG TPA: methylated-DNA--[protein]-cysteine S-methyltransferase [Methanoregulaceae archaeon]|nr:methylated-DNA--[protein]-cysteine S-methyltransferase [Methanoregulaceae archaeon]
MEVMSGSCRLGLWFVHVWWSGDCVHRVIFSKTGIPGDVPLPVRRYCLGAEEHFATLKSISVSDPTIYGSIYRAVSEIPFGTTQTYGEIGKSVGTSPRVVGQAMRRNPTPIIVPCHRVVAKKGMGGFSPSPEIKILLLDLERKAVNRRRTSKAA